MKVKTALSILSHGLKKPKKEQKRTLPTQIREQLFFREGWGEEWLHDAKSRADVFAKNPQSIQIEWESRRSEHGTCYHGSFRSPLRQAWLPEESLRAQVRLLLPKGMKVEESGSVPLCICFPMTGDEGYSIRTRTFAAPLVKKGFGVMMLENPYYGSRRPKTQKNYFLSRVQDMFVMCIAAVEEGRSLVEWASERGHSKIGVAGVSQGGMIAAAVGALSEQRLAMAISLAAHSPSVILNEGLLRTFVDWPSLGENPQEKLREIFSIGDICEMPKPKALNATFIVGAKRDLVVPSYSVKRIHEAWPGSRLKWLPGTHVTSIALHEKAFRKIVMKAFGELKSR